MFPNMIELEFERRFRRISVPEKVPRMAAFSQLSFSMKNWRWHSVAAVLTLAGAGPLLVSSCSTLERAAIEPPQIAGAHYVGNQVCADCHTNISRLFPGSPHARFYKDDLKWAPMAGCESCHGAGSEHVRVGGGRGKFIVNPGKDPAPCFQCPLKTHAKSPLPQHHPVVE